DREILVPLRGHEVAGEFLALGGIVDKRPNAFPLVTSLVHDLTGYRTGNVSAVNAVLSGLLRFLRSSRQTTSSTVFRSLC
ncbi:MAG: hypothetical protein ABGY41_06665, partial [Candidatus Poribacteria bacterium]